MATLCVLAQVFDRDGDGYITASELKQVLRMMGEYVTEREARDMVREADSDGDGRIDFDGSAPASTSALITHACMLIMFKLFCFQNSSKKFTCPTIETFSSTNSKLRPFTCTCVYVRVHQIVLLRNQML